MSQPGATDLLVVARRALLDALEALEDQREAVIVIGAQAVYMHTGAARVALPEATKDSDLAIDRRELADEPLLEEAMRRAEFEPDDQPGAWTGETGTPVDLMIPESMSDPGGMRGGRMPPHSKRAVRRAAGLEAAMVDYAWMDVAALEDGDSRVFRVKVAGPAALLIAKMHKLGERNTAAPSRLVDKDAHDVYRLLVGVETEVFVRAFARLLRDPLAGDATRAGLEYFAQIFAAGPDAIGCVMAGRAEELVGDPALVAQASAALAQDLVDALAEERE